MKKVVINADIGGFSITKKAVLRLRELGCEEAKAVVLQGETWPDGTVEEIYPGRWDHEYIDIVRDHPLLIQVAEELGPEFCENEYKIVEIPDDVEFEIHSGEMGVEWVAEKHRKWW